MFACPQCSVPNLDGTTICLPCSSTQQPLNDLKIPEATLPTGLDKAPSPETKTPERALLKTSRFETGSILAGRYRVVSALGRGGMGEVYRAEDLKLGCNVALKFLNSGMKRHEQRLAMLLDEARLARTVSHPNVCRVHDVDMHRDPDGSEVHFVSMEFIDGEDLASLLRRIGRLPQAKALDVAAELCDGLTAVHACGLLHRDLKPGNVMLDSQGRVRLTDFGLAIIASETSSLAGTPAYMAPEQLTSRLTTVRSDVYSLGLVLYEIFTGERAFQGTSPKEIAWNRIQSPPEPPSSLVDHLPQDIEGLILACLEKVPEHRPQSADAVASGLACITGETSRDPTSSIHDGEMLRAVLACDLIAETASDDPRADELTARVERLVSDLQERHGGQTIHTIVGLQLLFERPAPALQFALGYHEGLEQLSREERSQFKARIGLHFGEVQLLKHSSGDLRNTETLIEVADGPVKSLANHLMNLAREGQTLLSSGAFGLARRSSVNLDDAEDLRWLDHGAWRLHGVADPVDIYEVGHEGRGPLQAPEESETVRRLLMQPRVEGWRPAPGLHVPGRPNWHIEERLGEGGFGEAWRVRHAKTGEPRCFKFCFDAERLRALQREITLFRLLKEELGDRKDINRLLDWNLDESPYFIESEYTHAGDLKQWVKGEGGLDQIPLETRLNIVAQIAEALAAAHSVGVLHKDVKPSNILIRQDSDGQIQAQLADFGVGQVTEKERLAAAGITVLGLSRRAGADTTSSHTGTPLYQAPELLEGRTPTLQSDIYSLGVLLYQVVSGDFHRALAPGWRREIQHELLAEDIGLFVDGLPERRPDHANEVAKRLRTLDQRRQEHQTAIAAKRAFEVAQRRRGVYKAVTATSLIALVAVSCLAVWAIQAGREERRAHEMTERVLDYMVGVFDIADPYITETLDGSYGATVTAREILDRGVERLKTEFVSEPLIKARLNDSYGRIYSSLGLYDTAQNLQENALETRLRQLGSDHPETLQSMHGLGVTFGRRGQPSRSVDILAQASNISERILGPEHLSTLRTRRSLSFFLLGLQRFEEARVVGAETLETQIHILGEEHPETLESMFNLGLILQFLNRVEESREINDRSLRIRRRVLGEEHPLTLRSMVSLANNLEHSGELEHAKKLREKILEVQSRILGDRHPETLYSMKNLAISFFSLGEFKGAKEILRKTLELQSHTLGEDHPKTVDSMNSLAMYYRLLGEYNDARKLQEQALEIHSRILGDEHPETLHSMNHLAHTLAALGEFEKSNELQERTLKTQSRALEIEPRDRIILASSISTPLLRQGKYGEAKQILLAELESAKRLLGPEDSTTLWIAGNLAYSQSSLVLGTQEDPLLEELPRNTERVFGVSHPQTLFSKYIIAKNLGQQGLLEEAESLQNANLRTSLENLGEKAWLSFRLKLSLGEIKSLHGEWRQAKNILEDAMRFRKEVVQSDHPELQELKTALAFTLLKLGEVEEAREYARSALASLEKTVGIRNSLTTDAAHCFLEIVQYENDSQTTRLLVEKLQWLTETDETDIESAKQLETRRYVIEVMAGLKDAA